jgi:hypothetical protein
LAVAVAVHLRKDLVKELEAQPTALEVAHLPVVQVVVVSLRQQVAVAVRVVQDLLCQWVTLLIQQQWQETEQTAVLVVQEFGTGDLEAQ